MFTLHLLGENPARTLLDGEDVTSTLVKKVLLETRQQREPCSGRSGGILLSALAADHLILIFHFKRMLQGHPGVKHWTISTAP